MTKWWYVVMCAVCFVIGAGMNTGCTTTGNGVSAADDDLADAVMTRLDHDPVTAACRLMVVVKDGVVYLRGKAPTSNMVRARAVSVALGTPGVVEVVDDLYPPTNGVY